MSIKNLSKDRKEKSIKVAMRSYNRLNKLEQTIREDFSSADDEISPKFDKLDINNLKMFL